MKLLAVVAIAQFVGTLPSIAQSVTGEPTAAMKACIATHAPAAEQAITSLTEAVDFLVQKTCVAPLTEQADLQQAERTKKMAAAQKARTLAMCKSTEALAPPKGGGDGGDGDFYMRQMCDPAVLALDDGDAYSAMLSSVHIGNPEIVSPAATSLAAQTLLKLRVDRMNRKP